MGKREEVKKPRMPRDFYGTVDPDAVKPLIPYVQGMSYIEPCAGAGHLSTLLNGHCRAVGHYDIEPLAPGVVQRNCLSLSEKDMWPDCQEVDCFITNPPFSRQMLLPIIDHLPRLRPTWLLLPADLMHNKYMSNYLKICTHILSVGRLWWFEDDKGKKVKGVDNYAWYRFYECARPTETIFVGRD